MSTKSRLDRLKKVLGKKKTFDFEHAEVRSLSDLKGQELRITDFEVYTSRKYDNPFVALLIDGYGATEDGKRIVFKTWSEVIHRQLVDIKEAMGWAADEPYDLSDIAITLVERETQSGALCLALELPEE